MQALCIPPKQTTFTLRPDFGYERSPASDPKHHPRREVAPRSLALGQAGEGVASAATFGSDPELPPQGGKLLGHSGTLRVVRSRKAWQAPAL